jgi:DNA-binding MarR family transcriptional regulator
MVRGDKSNTRPSNDAESALVDGLAQLSFEVQTRLATIAARHDLSLTQVRLLGVLRDREPGIQQLAEHLGLEKSSVSGLVDRAEARGLVRRTTSADDGRAVRVVISPKGRALAEKGEREVRVALLEVVAVLTNAERFHLADLLARCLAP